MEQQLPTDSEEVQKHIRQHFEWFCQFWTPNRESYTGYEQLVLDSELRNACALHHPDFTEFAAAAIATFSKS
ncbi:MAG: hypothetical protein M2R45_01751 [Verrucomicrobia subdivision 3 bacterium]|nr:hypothetical protein [Limisphaerales bacterium]MCS1413488.1 hypothetical protein [Limisphaerales bacterium]